MKHRTFEKIGLKVSEIGLGTWELSGDVYGKKDDTVSIKTIHTALSHGVNFIDTAQNYGNGHVEELVGKALKDWNKSDAIIISTKVRPKCGIWAPPPERDIDDFFHQSG